MKLLLERVEKREGGGEAVGRGGRGREGGGGILAGSCDPSLGSVY